MAIPIYDQIIHYSTPPHSYIGTCLFLSYIVLALYATISITFSLYKQYKTIYQNNLNLQASNVEDAENLKTALVARDKHIRIYAFIALINFSTLSLHMLNFLIDHYSNWTGKSNGMNFSDVTIDNLKSWMLDSTLFRDFAHDLVKSPANAVWTQAAILGTWFWNIWIAGKAQQYGLPASKMAPFILLSQILPMSFTASLFIIQLHLSRAQTAIQPHDPNSKAAPDSSMASTSKTSLSNRTRKPIASLHLPNIMLNALLLAQPLLAHQRASTQYTIPILLLERLILLLPHSGLLNLKDSAVVKAITISGAFVSTSWYMSRRELVIKDVVRALTGETDYAVKALGWDAVLGGLLYLVLGWGGAV